MPIKPENHKLYPKDWKAISRRIRFERAEGKCEQCERVHGHFGYWNVFGDWEDVTFPQSMSRAEIREHAREHGYVQTILTVAHLNHDPTDNREENLRALCQRCHNRHDMQHRQANAKRTRADKAEGPMFKGVV